MLAQQIFQHQLQQQLQGQQLVQQNLQLRPCHQIQHYIEIHQQWQQL